MKLIWKQGSVNKLGWLGRVFRLPRLEQRSPCCQHWMWESVHIALFLPSFLGHHARLTRRARLPHSDYRIRIAGAIVTGVCPPTFCGSSSDAGGGIGSRVPAGNRSPAGQVVPAAQVASAFSATAPPGGSVGAMFESTFNATIRDSSALTIQRLVKIPSQHFDGQTFLTSRRIQNKIRNLICESVDFDISYCQRRLQPDSVSRRPRSG